MYLTLKVVPVTKIVTKSNAFDFAPISIPKKVTKSNTFDFAGIFSHSSCTNIILVISQSNHDRFMYFLVCFGAQKEVNRWFLEGYPKRPVQTGFEQFFIGFSKIPKIRNCKLNWYCNCCNCNRRSGLVHQFLTVLWTRLSNTSHNVTTCYSSLC